MLVQRAVKSRTQQVKRKVPINEREPVTFTCNGVGYLVPINEREPVTSICNGVGDWVPIDERKPVTSTCNGAGDWEAKPNTKLNTKPNAKSNARSNAKSNAKSNACMPCAIPFQRGIRFLSFDEFAKMFPWETDGARVGHSSNVFSSTDGNHVIKITPLVYENSDFVCELNAHSQIQHDHILRPLAFSIHGSTGYMAFVQGIPLIDVCSSLHPSRIARDVLSGIRFLNEHGFVHGDIKPYNMVYLKHLDRCMLIDLGRCRRAVLHQDGNYYCRGLCYTFPYQDDAYVVKQWNRIECEQQPLLLSLVQLNSVDCHKVPHFGSLHQSFFGIVALDTLLTNVQVPLDERKPWRDILEDSELSMPQNTKTTNDVSSKPNNDHLLFVPSVSRLPLVPVVSKPNGWTLPILSHHETEMKVVNAEAVVMGYEQNLHVDIVIGVLHLIRFCMVAVENTMTQAEWSVRRKLFVCVSYNIVLASSFHDRIAVLPDCQKLSGTLNELEPDDFIALYNRLFCAILIVTNGFTSSYTFWDYARSHYDLPAILFDMVFLMTDATKIRSAVHSPVTNKSYSMNALLLPAEYQVYKDFVRTQQMTDKPMYRDLVPLVNLLSTQVFPTFLDVTADLRVVRHRWSIIFSEPDGGGTKMIRWNEERVQQFCRGILRNRSVLEQLSLKDAHVLFYNLLGLVKHKEWSDYGRFLLTTLCKIPWVRYTKVHTSTLLAHPHPFATPMTDEDCTP